MGTQHRDRCQRDQDAYPAPSDQVGEGDRGSRGYSDRAWGGLHRPPCRPLPRDAHRLTPSFTGRLPWISLTRRTGCRYIQGVRRCLHGQADPEEGPTAVRAAQTDRAPMPLNSGLHDSQAEADPRLGLTMGSAVIAFKHTTPLCRGNARTVVPYTDLDDGDLPVYAPRADDDSVVVYRIFVGVDNQV